MNIGKPIANQASATVLVTFAVTELAAVIGLSPSLTSGFLNPANTAVSMVIFLACLMGIYGILKGNRAGIYFALLASLFEIVLGFSFLAEILAEAKLAWMPAVQSLLTIALGGLCAFMVSNMTTTSEPLMKPRSSAKKLHPQGDGYAVEVINVTKKYAMGTVVVPAINGLTMRIRRGEFVAVMGPSGCGKSTLLNLIGALDRPTSGHVLIDGIDISTLGGLSQAQLRNQKVGFVFQSYNLIDRSNVLRNVELPMLVNGTRKEQRTARTSDMLNVVGLESMMSRKPKTLSGGEQQRVAIARALVNKPKIVLADEPTGNLDSKSGQEILNFLRDTNKEFGTTVVMVTHNREAAEMADRIVYLRDGRIEKEESAKRNPN